MPKAITVLVAGATGKQGGAVARLLLEKGHRVRVLTRRPGAKPAASLLAAGAEVHEGDLEDAASVERAAEGADAFFLMATPFEQGVAAEVRQAERAAAGARSAGVKHLVYSSVAGADRDTGIPHFDSKREVERYVQGLGVPYTIVAPAFFMENLLGPMFLHGLRAG
ncbi:MAG TPA: NmrA family NAD(P)-binding protein, partial [Anaeromyxobacteraceae bacterium]